MTTATYYTLLQRDDKDSAWGIAFGDYDKETVEDELQDYRDHDVKKSNLKIVKTKGHGMDEINIALTELNKGKENMTQTERRAMAYLEKVNSGRKVYFNPIGMERAFYLASFPSNSPAFLYQTAYLVEPKGDAPFLVDVTGDSDQIQKTFN